MHDLQAFSKVYYVWSIPLVLLVFALLEYRLVQWSVLTVIALVLIVVPTQLFFASVFTKLRQVSRT